MKEFICKYENRIHGVLSCFDRMVFHGYLAIMSGWKMAEFLYRLNVNFSNLKTFLLENSERVKNHAIAMAEKDGRRFQYLKSNIDKDQTARKMAQRDGIEHGLVCIFSILEPCRSFWFRFAKPRPDQRPFVKPARRKCLHLGPEMGSVFIECKPWWPNSRNGLVVGIDGNVATGGTLTLPWRLNNTAPAEGDRTFGRHG